MKMRRSAFDLVYLDPPYARRRENRPKNYHSMYHFLEGMLSYDEWKAQINWATKNRALIHRNTEWDSKLIADNFDRLFKKFRRSIIVVSYGEPGNPSIETMITMLKKYKSTVNVVKKSYNYKLNHKNGGLYEVLLIGT
jgi:adenine-specific DNA methylase